MTYFARKIGFYLLALWGALTLNFFLPRLVPGNPVDILIARMSQNGAPPPGTRAALTRLLGLSGGNIFVQYGQYFDQLAHFNLGISVTNFPEPVTEVIASGLPWTLVLVGVSTILSFVIGTALGALAGSRNSKVLDALAPATTFLTAVPYFWLALLFLYLFGVVWKISPINGGYDASLTPGLSGAFLGSAIVHSLVPALTIVLAQLGGWMLSMRNMTLLTRSEDYVVAAGAKGLTPRRILMGYVGRNAVLPSVTGFAISLGFVVSGSIIMEIVFSYPGIGYLLLQAVQNSDYAQMQGIFLVITIAVLGANFIVDMLYGFVDPRTRQAT